MKIIHVINSMSTSHGGPTRTALLTMQGTRSGGMDVEIVTNEPAPGEEAVSNDPSIRYLPPVGFRDKHWGYSKAISQELAKIKNVDIYHIQGIWLYSGYITARYAHKQGCPYLITLHGTLYPEALAQSSRIKKIAMNLYQHRQLQQAACIHATCMEEMEHYRALGFTNPVAVLPYPMECGDKMEPMYPKDIKRIGYLGRVHPRKRVERLLEIWSHLKEPGELLIMGDGDPAYIRFLKKETERLKLRRVKFEGFVTGEKKNRLLASLTCLVVPSDFENCGIITPEALLQEIPVIASTGSPWQDLETYGCGRWVCNDVDTLTGQVKDLLSMDENTLYEMGKRGRQLVLDKYSVDVVSRQMKELYAWVAGQGDKPAFVYD